MHFATLQMAQQTRELSCHTRNGDSPLRRAVAQTQPGDAEVEERGARPSQIQTPLLDLDQELDDSHVDAPGLRAEVLKTGEKVVIGQLSKLHVRSIAR